MAAEAIRYINSKATFFYGGNVDTHCLKCKFCDAAYHVHYSNAEINRIEDCRTLAADRISAEHPDHRRSILL